MPNVYVVNRGPYDFSDAERFGELVFCTAGSVDRWDTAQMCRELSAPLRDSEPDDYILLTSLTSLCSIACSIFTLQHGRLNLLIFKDGKYVERKLVFNDVSEVVDEDNEYNR